MIDVERSQDSSPKIKFMKVFTLSDYIMQSKNYFVTCLKRKQTLA